MTTTFRCTDPVCHRGCGYSVAALTDQAVRFFETPGAASDYANALADAFDREFEIRYGCGRLYRAVRPALAHT